MIAHPRRRVLPLLALTTLLILALHKNNIKPTTAIPPWLQSKAQAQAQAPSLSFSTTPQSRRITKLSMLYGTPNTLYTRALQSHNRHAQRWGYGMDILSSEIADGYWNKPAYLLERVVAELAKPVDAEGRVEWVMWVDADSILINPAIPLEIFLPPPSLPDIHMVATKDHKGLNTGIFFLRVHKWTVRMLIESLAYPIYNPHADLDVQVDQSAMEKVLNKTEYRDGVTYFPRPWINTYEWKHAYEGQKGDMLVHFPGLGEERWTHMAKWLDVVESTPKEWEVDVQETKYLNETMGFWDRINDARGIIGQYRARNESSVQVEALKRVLDETPFEADLVQQRIDECKHKLG